MPSEYEKMMIADGFTLEPGGLLHRPLSADTIEAVHAIHPTDWSSHVEAVRPAIQELDRKDAGSRAAAPTIVVTNNSKPK